MDPLLAICLSSRNQISLNTSERLFAKIRGASSEQLLSQLSDKLLKEQPLLNPEMGRGSIFWRGRKSKSPGGFKNLREVSYPPPQLA